MSESVRSVRGNVAWNLTGQIIPLAVALICIPLTIKGMGTERFGALSIVWTLLVYFGFLDLGLGRSLMQLLAAHEGSARTESLLVWTNFAVLGALGFAAGALLFGFSPWIASHLLRLQGSLAAETLLGLRLFALAMPLLIHDTVLRGVLEAKRRFDLSNRTRVAVGIFTYVAPLLVLPFTRNLATVVGVMLLGRVAAWMANFWMVFRILPHLSLHTGWEPRRIPGYLKLGVWYLVPSALGPALNTMDRFFISNLLSISLVAYYVTPYEMVTKLWILSAGIGAVTFTEFSVRFRKSPAEARTLLLRGLRYTLAALFPIALIVVAYAHEGLAFWLDPAFADASAPVLRWLAVFVLISGSGHILNSFLLGAGRADLPARLQLLELPFYAALLYLLLKLDGIRGAAIASFIRAVFEFSAQLFLSGSILRFTGRTYAKVLAPLALTVVVLAAAGLPLSGPLKAALVAGSLLAYCGITWRFVLEAKDKRKVLTALGRA